MLFLLPAQLTAVTVYFRVNHGWAIHESMEPRSVFQILLLVLPFQQQLSRQSDSHKMRLCLV